jgi:hypothetical protein
LNEDDFFNALDDQRADCNQQNGELVNGVPMSSPGQCNDLTTMTLRDVLMQNIFSHATVLHVPEDAKCEENVGLSLQLHTLSKNITNLQVQFENIGMLFINLVTSVDRLKHIYSVAYCFITDYYKFHEM